MKTITAKQESGAASGITTEQEQPPKCELILSKSDEEKKF